MSERYLKISGTPSVRRVTLARPEARAARGSSGENFGGRRRHGGRRGNDRFAGR
ncbi:MAG: hypothetical protein PHI18_08575 [bacterium]|nr:hypothetical protein [bacterium]